MKFRKKMTAILLTAIFMTSALAVTMSVSADPYSFSTTAGGVDNAPVEIDVTDDGTHITWTIDYPMETPYDSSEGNGKLCVGLVIALDGEGPAFQIHNNDGSDHDYDFGTWLYSEWGPIDEGYFGWFTGTGGNNIPVDDSTLDWVSCTGERDHADNPDGIFTISIDRSELGDDFHWALNLAIGTGFTDYTYEQMSYPVGNGFMGTPAFEWDNPIVDDAIPNYEYALLSVPPTPQTRGEVLKAKGVPGEGIDEAPGLGKPLPNDNFAARARKGHAYGHRNKEG